MGLRGSVLEMTDETFETIAVLEKLGKYTRVHGNTDFWIIRFGSQGDFAMVSREPKSRYFHIRRSYFGKPYTDEPLGGFELLEALAERCPELAKKLAEPMEG